ncbi:MAG: hypothetical protein QXR80_07080 [Desulfurococcaceae archaeon]
MPESKSLSTILIILEKVGIRLPSWLLRNESMRELGKIIKEPTLVSIFLKRVASNIDSHVDVEKIRDALKQARETLKYLEGQVVRKPLASDEDVKIIEHLVKHIRDKPLKFIPLLKLIEVHAHYSKITEEIINHCKKVSDSTLFYIWSRLFADFYESILHIVDSVLYIIIYSDEELKKQVKKRNKDFLSVKREQFEHAPAGTISKVLRDVFKLNTGNSIFDGKTRKLRNYIAHNVIHLHKDLYKFETLLEAHARLLFFTVKWLEVTWNKDSPEELAEALKKDLKNYLERLSGTLLKIERSGMSKIYREVVAKIERSEEEI